MLSMEVDHTGHKKDIIPNGMYVHVVKFVNHEQERVRCLMTALVHLAQNNIHVCRSYYI